MLTVLFYAQLQVLFIGTVIIINHLYTGSHFLSCIIYAPNENKSVRKTTARYF